MSWLELASYWHEIQTSASGGTGTSSPGQVLVNIAGSVAGDAGLTYDAATDTLTSGVFTVTTTDTGAATKALIMEPLDSSVATTGVWMGNSTFTGVKDPTMFWGYNYTPVKAGHPRLYWALEGNYNDVGNGHAWAETYLERQDSPGGGSYRPFGIGTYDGHAEAAFYIDSVIFNARSGGGGFGEVVPAGAEPYLLVYPTATITALGNNRGFLRQASALYPGAYLDLLGLDSSDRVMLGPHWAIRGVVIQSGVLLGSKATALTDATPTAFATFTIADATTYGGKIIYSVVAVKGTALQRLDGEVRFNATREGSTYTATVGTTHEALGQVLSAAAGTLTGGVTIACTAGVCTLSATFDTSQATPDTFVFNGRFDSPDAGLTVTWIP